MGHVKFDSQPQILAQEQRQMPRSPSGMVTKDAAKNQAAYSKNGHADDKEGTISSCGQSDSLNRPNINARLRSTSAFGQLQRLPFHA